ncbi:MAG: hypothetical protein ACLFWD_12915 [Anaerolineales bacterium]
MRLWNMRRIIALLPVVLLGGLLLAACNFPGGQPAAGEDTLATQAAQTVAAELTETGGERSELRMDHEL